MKWFTTQIDKTRGKPDTATSCKSGFGASIWKPSAVMCQGAGYLAYFVRWILRHTASTFPTRKAITRYEMRVTGCAKNRGCQSSCRGRNASHVLRPWRSVHRGSHNGKDCWDVPGEAESIKAGKSGRFHAHRYSEQYQGSGKQRIWTVGEDTQLEAGGIERRKAA